MPLLGGRLCEVANTNPLLPLLTICVSPIKVQWGLVPLSYASDSGAARICQRGGGGGGKARVRSDQAGEVFFPSHGREIFWKFLCENGIVLHIKCHY